MQRMTKAEMLKMVGNMPDSTTFEIQDYQLGDTQHEDWRPDYSFKPAIGGPYSRNFETKMRVEITMPGIEQAGFLRTYENPDGKFYPHKVVGR